MSVRVQRRRARGWRMPEGARYVGRGTRWGNPYTLLERIPADDLEQAVRQRAAVLISYRLWLRQQLEQDPAFLDPLRGRDLVCWCPLDVRCHADILLERLEASA